MASEAPRYRALDEREVAEEMKALPGWTVEREGTGTELMRAYRFESFEAAMEFMRAAAEEIRVVDHHPRWTNVYRNLEVRLTTHSLGNQLSDRDFRVARFMEELYQKEYASGARNSS